MPFKRLESSTKPEFVFTQILEAIKIKEYNIGDKLPSEMEISEQIGVSRASVREAISALRLLGVLETKKGEGTYVASDEWSIDSKKKKSIVPEIFEDGGNTFETLEARRVVELAVAEYAAEMMNEEELSKILNAFREMEEAGKQNDFRTFHDTNKKLHYAIVETTKNTSLISYVRSLLNLFTESHLGKELRERYLTEEKYVRESIKIHKAICDALKSRNKNKIKKAYVQHFDQVEKQLLGR